MPSTDLRRLELSLRTESYDYRTPMKFGGRIVNDVTVLSVDCAAETGEARADGFGSMTMGVTWAWPDPAVDDETKLAVVLELAGKFAEAFQADGVAATEGASHPLDVCHRMVGRRDAIAASVASERGLPGSIPALAVLLAVSPIEAALFDAHGKAAGRSSYAMLHRDFLPRDMAHYLDDAYRGVHLSDLISAEPVAELPLYHLVGALDPLDESEVAEAIGDGMPETLGEWIRRDGLTHLKIKLAGDDIDWDVARVLGIHRVAALARPELGADWAFSLDFNERCENEDYVLELLDRVSRESPQAVACIRYIEQPTHRDLESNPDATMHRVAEKLPVVIDESLVDLRSLRTAISQGYSGIALKACKGHAEALLLGAVAAHENRYLCVQDLSCVGASLLHSASIAAHVPGVAAVESNGRQYCPAANERWLGRFRDFFEIRNGKIPTGQLNGPGLGYGDDPARHA